MTTRIATRATIILAITACACADCPLDHFTIGCNRDGIDGTEDDRRIFVDCEDKYRNSGEIGYEKWYYPLRESVFPSFPFRIGEPGFDVFQDTDPGESHTYDPNRAFKGDPDFDYRITVECIALSPGLQAVHKDYPQFTISRLGDAFNHSNIHSQRGDSHIHMVYQATDGKTLHWITFRIYDAPADGNQYEPSEPFTIVFNAEPLAGDLAVDGRVDIADLYELSHYWLAPESSGGNDYCERADANRDGSVNLIDFALMASNWRAGAEE